MTLRSPPRPRAERGARPPLTPSALLAVALALGACSSDGGSTASPSPPEDATSNADGDTAPDTSVVVGVNAGDDPTTEGSPDTPAGTDGNTTTSPADIARYGVVAVGDENGRSSGDALASFSRLSANVSLEAFGAALVPSTGACTIGTDDGRPDLMLVSALYLPTPDGVGLESIGAGDAVLLSSANGSWSELQGRPSDRFYTRSSSDAPPAGAVPDGLVANVTGDAFPAFADAPFPDVTPLAGVEHAGDGTITADTRFTWQPSGDANARVRIETTSVASFFDDRGVSLSCLAPDTGEFVFPADTRAALGADFAGAAPDFSRVAIDSRREGDALLVLVRESFVAP